MSQSNFVPIHLADVEIFCGIIENLLVVLNEKSRDHQDSLSGECVPNFRAID